MLHKRIEEAALNAWPALQQILFDGWVLRFAEGYTKRANSVTPLFASSINASEKVAACEQFYREKELPCIFRLTSFVSPELDHLLAQRGYTILDPTLILHFDLQHASLDPTTSATLQHKSLDDWMNTFCRLSATTLEQHETHRAILDAIAARRMLVSLSADARVVACGMGVLEQEYFGLFDILTAPQQRNQGYGTSLVTAMLVWAMEQGAQHAYLQVVDTNAPARHLYAKFGFQELYRYWYRVLLL
jgi:ribosomal protein S18 acetylase RimI-like enzyme